MNKNTKIALVGGGAVIAAYFLLSPSSDDAGLGGGGGMPLLPILPEEGESAVGDVIYNFPANPFVDPGFTGFEDPVTDEAVKKVTTEPVKLDFPSPTGYVRDINPVTGIARTTGTAIRTTPEGSGLFASLASSEFAKAYKKAESTPTGRTQEGVASGDILNWNFQDAANNVGLWLLGAPQPPKPSGVIDKTATVSKKAGIANVTDTSKTVVTKLLPRKSSSSGGYSGGSGYTGGFSAAGGFSRVRISADNPKGTPGWKQVGAKKPTAPGQPDRY